MPKITETAKVDNTVLCIFFGIMQSFESWIKKDQKNVHEKHLKIERKNPNGHPIREKIY